MRKMKQKRRSKKPAVMRTTKPELVVEPEPVQTVCEEDSDSEEA